MALCNDFKVIPNTGYIKQLDLEESNSFADIMYNRRENLFNSMANEMVSKRDETIKAALVKNGLNPNDIEFLTQNIQKVVFNDFDKFDHYFYRFGQPDEKRIISIERNPTIEHDLNSEDFSTRINVSQRYY